MARTIESVAFGGGCFWCTEAVFLELKGVSDVTPGYAGGTAPNPSYKQVSTGNTGYAEVIRIEYDPEIIPFTKLLEVFFASHDPTTLNRQGNDVGTQYRSVIFYENEIQKAEAEKYLYKITESKKYGRPIVTEISRLDRFYPAEEYHKRYYENHPDAGYSAYMIAPKVEKIRKEFREQIKDVAGSQQLESGN